MEMDAAPDVLVVGAGPAGLTMAAELARHGARCRIIEATPAPAATSRAIVIHARTLELFAVMGIADRVVTAGQKIHALQMHADGRAVFRLSLDPLDTPQARRSSSPLLAPGSWLLVGKSAKRLAVSPTIGPGARSQEPGAGAERRG
jgi:2-polyprenyl-6-methoxyphenol hydroxylase-like FAD-dependent oxidoreductase